MKTSLLRYSLIAVLSVCAFSLSAQNTQVKKVYTVFKTHLDVGFTDYSSAVETRYVQEFIPKALDVAEQLRADGSNDRYVWTTGSWLILRYIQQASPEAIKRLEKAIQRGDIVWNAVPYTVETETMNKDLLATTLQLSKKLDKKYGKHTIAAKMTDVPGHTRSIVPILNKAGIKFLHIGVNGASAVPGVPPFCRWRDHEGNEIILMYQQNYGSEDILPGGQVAISINFTGDNHGPHKYEKVKAIYEDLRKRYPNAEIIACSFNEIAQEMQALKNSLPVVTSEIGDTWIYGYGSSPIRMAKFRALQRLYSQWLAEGKLDQDSDVALDFAVELGLIAEHTQGMDVKRYLKNWDKYDVDVFNAARSTEPFQKMEKSWAEIDAYLDNAIAYLPNNLQKEARAALMEVDNPKVVVPDGKSNQKAGGTWTMPLLKNGLVRIGGLYYEMLDSADYRHYQDNYLRNRPDWATRDFGKPQLQKSKAVSAHIAANVVLQQIKNDKSGTRTISQLAFPETPKVDKRVYPEKMYADVSISPNGRSAELTLSIINKPAVRLPEAYWLSFNASDIVSLVAEKTGCRVDLLDVVEKGNRQQHGIDRYVDIITSHGTVRIWSKDAFLVNVGEAQGLNYSTTLPDKKGGIHFCLSNNLWGTNFSMWNEGSLSYRFFIELL